VHGARYFATLRMLAIFLALAEEALAPKAAAALPAK
jgi:hypothetical protein